MRLRERRQRPWGRRTRDRVVQWALALVSATLLAALAEIGTGLGHWMWGMLWAWLAPVTGR